MDLWRQNLQAVSAREPLHASEEIQVIGAFSVACMLASQLAWRAPASTWHANQRRNQRDTSYNGNTVLAFSSPASKVDFRWGDRL